MLRRIFIRRFFHRLGSIGSNNEAEAHFLRIPLPVFDLFVGVGITVSHPQTRMTNPLGLQLWRRPVLPQDRHPRMAEGVEAAATDTEFLQ